MCHVAAEMERQNFDLPLLIGGATTSRVHTAVKINPNYKRGQTVYVTDASRAVGVAQALMSRDGRKKYVDDTRAEYVRIAATHARAQEDKKRLSLKDARGNALKLDWAAYAPPAPTFLGSRVIDDISIAELIDYIDWSPFFSDLGAGRKIPGDPRRQDRRRGGALALRRRAEDAERDRRRRAGSRPPRWRASGRPIHRATTSQMFGDASRGKPIATLHTLRQQLARREGRANVALADFVAPSGRADHIGAFVVTAGIGEDEVADRFKNANDDYSSIMVKALADRLAEAFAERLHQKVRKEFWGYAADETLEQRRSDRRKIPRHPAGARLSGAARPHREGHAVPAARRRADRREADRELCDVAGRLGLRALFQPPGEPLFRRRQDRARPGRGLRRPQGLDAWRRPSAGSRRSSITIRRSLARDARPER